MRHGRSNPQEERWRARLATRVAARTAGDLSRAVGVFGGYVPLELPLALGLEPLVLSFGGSPQAMQLGEKYVRADACPFCRSQVGVAEAAPWLGRVAFLAAFSACDQENRMLETCGRFLDLEIQVAGAPRTRSPNALARYREDLERLRCRLEERFEAALETARLAGAVAKMRRLRARLRARRADLEFADFAELVQGCLMLGVDPALEFLASLEPKAPPAARPLRLFLAGSCVARDDLVFARELAELGAEIVGDLTRLVGGLLACDVPEGTSTLAALAEAYFHQPDMGARPNDGYYAALAQAVEAVRVDGVLLRCLKFCDIHSGERRRVKEALEPLPVLFLDDEYDAAARPRRRTRLESFVEMIRCRKA
ncbi:MAG: 2-hydroxyacyl-CoA dehydratase [Planctomycetes bacterium]|nr:2-hydroxyacyl-CoA dehydratase [Planctomycetota bacterium]